jgi:single-stranded-DNA-specific exonuclease
VDARLEIPPCSPAEVLALERALGCSSALGQVLVRRGLGDPAAARAFLAARDEHDPGLFDGIGEAVAVIERHVAARTRITVHGDYDVDGVASTAILVRALRALGADVDSYLPSRTEDGYGLSLHTVQRLAKRGTKLLVTTDCAITAIDEVAAARAAGIDVVVTDHHTPRPDGRLPDAPIVHPRVGHYPCPDLCAAGVAHKLALALGAPTALEDLDLVALATVADCVPLIGENRRLVRDGLQALRATRKPGLRALMEVAGVEPGAIDARTIGFRLAPRINAAGRLQRADAGLELLLTDDPARAAEIAPELDDANTERRHVEQRILFEAEAQAAQFAHQPALVLAGVGWHPGVIGIVASRIVERHRRPALLIALPGGDTNGTASGRSIAAFDLLGALDACSAHLIRHGGHRAAAGATVAPDQVDALRAAFERHAASVLAPEDLAGVERVDAVVGGGELGLELAEELERLAPFGQSNPEVSLLVSAARLVDARSMGENKHVRFTVESGESRAAAVAFGTPRLPPGAAEGLDATFRLELNEYRGAIAPRLVLRNALAPRGGPIEVVGEGGSAIDRALAELDADLEPRTLAGAPPASDRVLDRRGHGLAGTLAAVVASGEPVLAIGADAQRWAGALDGRLGGFAVTSWLALQRDPRLADDYAHLVALDPPPTPRAHAVLAACCNGRLAHLAWGSAEVPFALHVHEHAFDLGEPLRGLYRALRGDPAAALGDDPARAGRLLRVLDELGLVEVDRDTLHAAIVEGADRTELERSPAFRAYRTSLEEGRQWLTTVTSRAA